MPPKTTKRILLTGASGYLGQHLLGQWMTNGIEEDCNYDITALYHSSVGFDEAVTAFQQSKCCHETTNVTVTTQSCDLSQPDTLHNLLSNNHNNNNINHKFDLVLHMASLSSPRACEQDPKKAQALNVPKAFFEMVKDFPMMALSTDQVYDGSRSRTRKNEDGLLFYQEDNDDEDDEDHRPNPLNVYGQTKLDMELYLKERHVAASTPTASTASTSTSTIILRSSIMLGPKAPIHTAHDTFFHFCASRDQQETTFFTNEYRTVVSVQHVCRVITWMMMVQVRKNNNNNTSSNTNQENSNTGVELPPKPPNHRFEIYNLGGPNRVNRYDMAEAVFQHLGYSTPEKYLVPSLQTSPTSPLDISMDSDKLQRTTGIQHEPATLKELVEFTFPSSSCEQQETNNIR
jgi:dTDP-4-dehydrorhamnose reductase